MHTVTVTRHGRAASRWLLPAAVLAWLVAVVWASLGGALAAQAQALMPAYAVLVAWGWPCRWSAASRLLRIHVFGFADFVVAVGTGLAFTRMGEPRMGLLTRPPMALIPLFGVGQSGPSHIVALNALMRRAVPARPAIAGRQCSGPTGPQR